MSETQKKSIYECIIDAYREGMLNITINNGYYVNVESFNNHIPDYSKIKENGDVSSFGLFFDIDPNSYSNDKLLSSKTIGFQGAIIVICEKVNAGENIISVIKSLDKFFESKNNNLRKITPAISNDFYFTSYDFPKIKITHDVDDGFIEVYFEHRIKINKINS